MKYRQFPVDDPAIELSLIVPLFNEVESVPILVEEVRRAMETLGRSWELVCVDDGSRDGTVEKLKSLAEHQPELRVVSLRRNFGQSAAMQAGIDHARGAIIVTLDGDLQNDPADIGAMLEKIDAGADLVLGWRKNRQDALLHRKLPSRIANWLIARTTGVPVRDLGCTLKAMRSELARELELYGEMHRFIPVLAHRIGARIVEMETHHRARKFGQTKYGLGRTTRVLLDLITVHFLLHNFASPMKHFGKMGLMVGAGSCLAFSATLAMKLISGVDISGNPLWMLGTLGAILSVQFFGLGLLGEVNARIYYSTSGRRNFHVRELVNFGQAQDQPDRRTRRVA